ncbi:hypothetical protein [Streptomyces sp. NPDC088752]|uniref:hypothetical protein n=1 Tax=Streptomyces sp. NPDC088752 TaxID=3154963 RepID=UPI0034174453
MAGLIDEDEMLPEQADGSTDPNDPFAGNSQKFTWAREMTVAQLQAELDETLEHRVSIAVILPLGEDGHPKPVSESDPATIYVSPSSADLSAVRKVLSAHRSDPYYGMTEEQRQNAQLREKIASGATLTPEEVQRALQILLGG